ncbi:U2 small nuclear ribonucleoprotein A' [Podochytrium sp. JEL0797]|nr:U2 small nuclear ribonucleoprotein A' [Podochytrium sp. JEL0797]
MKLDFDVLSNATQFVDPLKERCLDLRSLKIPRIENIAITKDLNDTIDLTDNDLTAVDNFPPMPRLKTLFLSNNRISSIAADTPKQLPNLANLILSNNAIAELGDLSVLGKFKNLVRVALLGNPVTTKLNYREWVIFMCPNVRVVDFRKVKDVEREAAKALFSGSKEAKSLAAEIASKTSTFVPGEGVPAAKAIVKPHSGPSPEEAERIKAAIESAGSLEEVARLKRQLEGGSVPAAKKR